MYKYVWNSQGSGECNKHQQGPKRRQNGSEQDIIFYVSFAKQRTVIIIRDLVPASNPLGRYF
jgi:hypothetical protein